MKSRLLLRLLVPAILTATLAAQTAPSDGGARGRGMRQRMDAAEARMLGMRDLRIAANLQLTAEQQSTIRAAFQEAAAFRHNMVAKGADLRTQLETAVKANDAARIDSVSRELAELLQQQIAFQAKTVAKVYGTLTEEQKAKLEEEVKRSIGLRDLRGRRGRISE